MIYYKIRASTENELVVIYVERIVVAKYGQYCPVAQALDILGDRWTLLIIRDMLTGTKYFNHLHRGLPGLSRALLSKRLQYLQETGIIVKQHNDDASKHTTEYRLTEAGIDLQPIISSLLVWGTKWSFDDPTEEQLDPLLLMWWMRSRVHQDSLPEERITIQFNFHSPKSDTYWLVLSKDDSVICVTDPGYEIQVIVTANLKQFFKVWLGMYSYHRAIEAQDIVIDAISTWQDAFPTWFAWSPAAEYVSQFHGV